MKIHSLIKYIYYAIATIIIVVLGISIFFLYNNFYNTLAQVRIVYVLKSQVAFETINIASWNKVIEKFENKKNPLLQEGTKIADPFIPLVEIEE